MNDREKILLLQAELKKTQSPIEGTHRFYRQVQANELRLLGKTQSTAMMVAQIVENSYTCLETLFLRISQFFENDLQKDKWHAGPPNNRL